jgi:hypothetical protein
LVARVLTCSREEHHLQVACEFHNLRRNIWHSNSNDRYHGLEHVSRTRRPKQIVTRDYGRIEEFLPPCCSFKLISCVMLSKKDVKTSKMQLQWKHGCGRETLLWNPLALFSVTTAFFLTKNKSPVEEKHPFHTDTIHRWRERGQAFSLRSVGAGRVACFIIHST